MQAVFGAAGEHAVWLGHALGDQVVHQHAQIGFVATRQPRRLALDLQGGVQACKQPLRRCLLVACGAVDLASKKQAFDLPGFKAAFQRARIEIVIFDGVAGPQNVRVFQPANAAHQRILNIERQAGGNAIGVKLVRAQAFRFQKNLVAVFACEAIDFVFHAGAVARPHALDLPREHGAAVKAAANDVVRALVGVGYPAWHLPGVHAGVAHEAENRHGVCVAGLLRAGGKINRAPVQARRRACFQPPLRQLELPQPRRQRNGRRIARAAARVVVQPDVDASIQKRARRQHHGPRLEGQAHLRDHAHGAPALHLHIIHCLLEQPEIGLVFQPPAHGRAVQHAIGLRARGAHGRPFAAVERAELNARFIRRQRHRAAQRIHLPHQMALANAANAGVAAHLPQGFNAVRQQQRGAAHAGRRQGRFSASVAAAHHNHVKSAGKNSV